jgi:hypothetical protein
MKEEGKRMKAKGKRQKSEGRSQKAEGRSIVPLNFVLMLDFRGVD